MATDLKAILARAAALKAGGKVVPNPPAPVISAMPDLDKHSFLDETMTGLTRASDSDMDKGYDFLADHSAAPALDIIHLEAGEIDPRLKLLSHSSRGLLHKCPRKYQLYRLASETVALEESKEIEQQVTFAYGHAVGIGMQSVLEGKSLEQCYIDCFLGWDADLLDENPRQMKSFWLAMFAVERFYQLRVEESFLADYELVYYNGKPAVELSFQVLLPNGFTYRGFLDGVLQHKVNKAVIVLESKTSSGKAQSATYKNSGQALGYSVVLDELFPELSSYSVLYLVYETKSFDYVELPFKKSLLQRALWLQELLIDCKTIELYDSYDTYPMHGEACYDFFRDCEYLSLCTLNTANLAKPLTATLLDKIAVDAASYQFTVDFNTLVERQLSKGDM